MEKRRGRGREGREGRKERKEREARKIIAVSNIWSISKSLRVINGLPSLSIIFTIAGLPTVTAGEEVLRLT